VKYSMRRNSLSFRRTCTVKDEGENDLYTVKSPLLSWGTKLNLVDMNGVEQAEVCQRLLSFMPAFEISIRRKKLAVVRQKLVLFGDRAIFNLHAEGLKNCVVNVSFSDRECRFVSEKEIIASVSAGFFSLTAPYDLDILDDEHSIVILAACLAIDNVCNRTFADLLKSLEKDQD